MISSDDSRVVVEHFRDAALGLSDWSTALVQLGARLDSPIVQLAGTVKVGTASLNISCGVDEEMMGMFLSARGFDPTVNPRTHRLINSAAWQSVTDADITTPERERLPIYGIFERAESDHAALVRMRNVDGILAGLIMMRSRRAGPHDDQAMRFLSAVTPGVEGAVRAGLALGGIENRAMLDTAERLDTACILVSADKVIVSLSPSAERELRRGTHFHTHAGCLHAATPQSDAWLDQAIRAAAFHAPTGQAGQSVSVVGAAGAPLRTDVFALPRRLSGALSLAQAMVIIRTARSTDPMSPAALRHRYGLTEAEAAIAALIAAGKTPAAIAVQRGSSVQTVRSQLKMIFEKTGTHRQAELAVLLRQLG